MSERNNRSTHTAVFDDRRWECGLNSQDFGLFSKKKDTKKILFQKMLKFSKGFDSKEGKSLGI